MRLLYLTIIILLSSIGIISAVDTELMSTSQLQPITVENRVVNEDGMELRLGISQPSWSEVGESEQPVLLTEYFASGRIEEEGYPSLPVASAMFRIPPRSGVVVEVLDAEYETYTDIDYAIYSGDGEYRGINRAEMEDSWFPGNLAELGSPAILHNFRVANLMTYPVQVNPYRGEVRVYSNIEVNITYEGEDDRNTLEYWPTHISEAMIPVYRTFLDWDDDELDEYVLYRGKVQVVMQDDDVLWDAMEDWFEWKRQRGWTLEFLHEDDVNNWSSTNIRNELVDRWEESDHKFDYVVIIGDNSGSFNVPAGEGEGDQPYSEVAGNDDLADVGLGRISVENNTQAVVYANKVLEYERDIDFDNTDWYLRGMVNVSDTHQGISKVQTMRYFRHAMLNIGYTQVDTSWHSGNAVAINRINDGVSFYGARGYVGTGIGTAEASNLSNEDMMPVVIDVTCATGEWTGGLGINEAYMRAGTAQSPRGGIGAFGMATWSTEPNFNHAMSGGSGWAMFGLRMLTMGDMMLMGKVNCWNSYNGRDDGGLHDFSEWYNLMGDPTVWVWTGIPEVLDVTAVEEIELGQNSYEVLVEADGNPVEDAWVTMYKVDNDEDVVVTGYTDTNGQVTLDVPIRYTGDAVLTVSKQHYAPTQVDVGVVSALSRIGYDTIEFQDDGADGTIGNGNGIPEAGEIIGLIVTARNFGESDLDDIEATVTSDEAWVSSVTGTSDFGSISSGASAVGEGLILVEIAPEAQHDWILHCDIEFTTSDMDYTDSFPIKVDAPMFAMIAVNGAGELEPGGNATITVEVINVGGSDASESDATLISADPFLTITQPDGNFAAMDIGDEDVSTSFEISAHENTISGHLASAKLVITTADSQVDTCWIMIILGDKESTDPSGPDNYGYYAFDDTDTEYDLAPDYDWIEISPEEPGNDYDGTALNISDPSENQDESVVVDLPDDFHIQYYGEVFEQITVCSNGWLAMGSQGDIYLQRNWTIPSPLGPNYMIAPYWDELRTDGDGSEVYVYYDQPNGRYIVEWYNMRHYNENDDISFQVVFYSIEARPTYTWDNDFIFQYYNITHHSGNSSWPEYDVLYWTTGIENGNQTDGLMLAYWNQEYPGAAEIEDERAILFTTNVAQITGMIEGTVTDIRTGDPIEGVEVHNPNYLYVAITDDVGYFYIDEVVIGTHELACEVQCYNDFWGMEITVAEDETTTVEIELRHPEIALDPGEIDVELFPDEQTTTGLNLTNPGEGILSYSAYVYFQDPQPEPPITGESFPEARGDNELDELFNSWDWAYQFDLDENETHNNGIIFWNKYFITTGSNNLIPGDANKFYQYDRYGSFITSVDQPVPADERSNNGILGLTWDGEYLYGADSGKLYQMEIQIDLGVITSIDLVDSWEIPANPARYVAYDPDHDLFWLGDHGSEIRGVNRAGEVVYEYGNEYSARGASWYEEDGSGYHLYLIGRSRGETTTYFVRMNPETGDTEVLYTYETLPGDMVIAGATVTPDWNPLVWAIATVVDYDPLNGVQVLVLDDHIEYFSIDNPNGSLEADSTEVINLNFDGSGLPFETYRLYLGFDNDACDTENNHLPITMLLPDTTNDVIDELEAQPLDWSFDGAYPNPFNPVVTVEFSLLNRVEVTASIYNLLGQEVGIIASGQMVPGRHSLSFDGSHLSSGMYFLRFQAGPINEVRKLVLMK